MRRTTEPLIRSSIGKAQESNILKKNLKKRSNDFDLILENESVVNRDFKNSEDLNLTYISRSKNEKNNLRSQSKSKTTTYKQLKNKMLAPKRISKNLRLIRIIRSLFTLSVLIFLIIFAAFISKLEFSIPRKNITQIIDISNKMNICSDLNEISKKSVLKQKN